MSWIQTYTGRKFWPLKPRVEDVYILDIAQGLSQEIRFTGQCSPPITVAQHSVLGSYVVPPEHALWFLLHDAPEAYLADISRPIKQSIWVKIADEMLPISEVEDRIMRCVCERFGLPWPEPPEVKEADTRMVVTEAKVVMKPPPEPWGIDAKPVEMEIAALSMDMAKLQFLERFIELTERVPYGVHSS